jgi:drug/metabolite transporter (DMT)-like permease
VNITGFLMPAAALSVISAAAYAVGAMLQQRLADRPMRRLVRMPLWWSAIAANGIGAVLHVVALRYGSLVLVQALGMLTLVFAVPMAAAVARRRPGRGQVVATTVTTAGLAGLLTLTGPSGGSVLSGESLVHLLLAVAPVLVVVVSRARVSGLLAAAGGGIAFGVVSAVTQTVAVRVGEEGLRALAEPLVVVAVVAVVALDVAGLYLTQMSYRAGLAAPLAVGTVANPLTAAAIGFTLLGERFTGGGNGIVLAVACGIATTAGIWALSSARDRSVAGHDSGGPFGECSADVRARSGGPGGVEVVAGHGERENVEQLLTFGLIVRVGDSARSGIPRVGDAQQVRGPDPSGRTGGRSHRPGPGRDDPAGCFPGPRRG